MEKEIIDLAKCNYGDLLITSQGSILKYIAPTPWEHHTYLDHVVMYVKKKDGKNYFKNSYGTRTNDGFVFKKNRIPEIDHDVIKIIPSNGDFNKTLRKYIDQQRIDSEESLKNINDFNNEIK